MLWQDLYALNMMAPGTMSSIAGLLVSRFLRLMRNAITFCPYWPKPTTASTLNARLLSDGQSLSFAGANARSQSATDYAPYQWATIPSTIIGQKDETDLSFEAVQ